MTIFLCSQGRTLVSVEKVAPRINELDSRRGDGQTKHGETRRILVPNRVSDELEKY